MSLQVSTTKPLPEHFWLPKEISWIVVFKLPVLARVTIFCNRGFPFASSWEERHYQHQMMSIEDYLNRDACVCRSFRRSEESSKNPSVDCPRLNYQHHLLRATRSIPAQWDCSWIRPNEWFLCRLERVLPNDEIRVVFDHQGRSVGDSDSHLFICLKFELIDVDVDHSYLFRRLNGRT